MAISFSTLGTPARLTGPDPKMPVSSRIRAADAAFSAVKNFYFASRYGERRLEPGISDFTFGNPHEMPLEGIVVAFGRELSHVTRTGLRTRPVKRSHSDLSPNALGVSLASPLSLPTLL